MPRGPEPDARTRTVGTHTRTSRPGPAGRLFTVEAIAPGSVRVTSDVGTATVPAGRTFPAAGATVTVESSDGTSAVFVYPS